MAATVAVVPPSSIVRLPLSVPWSYLEN